jgi:hypothetical protein
MLRHLDDTLGTGRFAAAPLDDVSKSRPRGKEQKHKRNQRLRLFLVAVAIVAAFSAADAAVRLFLLSASTAESTNATNIANANGGGGTGSGSRSGDGGGGDGRGSSGGGGGGVIAGSLVVVLHPRDDGLDVDALSTLAAAAAALPVVVATRSDKVAATCAYGKESANLVNVYNTQTLRVFVWWFCVVITTVFYSPRRYVCVGKESAMCTRVCFYLILFCTLSITHSYTRLKTITIQYSHVDM